MTPAEYMQWASSEESGLQIQTKKAGITANAFYRPHMQMILTDLGPSGLSDSIVKVKEKEYSGLQYYELTLQMDSTDFIKSNSNGKENYLSNLYYFTFAFQRDISLIYPGTDTLPVKLFHFERAYGVSPAKKFLLGFEDKNVSGNRVLRIDSPALPTGVINLYFENKNIEKAQAVELKI